MKKFFALAFGLIISNLISFIPETVHAYADDEYDFRYRDEDRRPLSQRRLEKNDWWNEKLKKSEEQDEYERRKRARQRLDEEYESWKDSRQKRAREEEEEKLRKEAAERKEYASWRESRQKEE